MNPTTSSRCFRGVRIIGRRPFPFFFRPRQGLTREGLHRAAVNASVDSISVEVQRRYSCSRRPGDDTITRRLSTTTKRGRRILEFTSEEQHQPYLTRLDDKYPDGWIREPVALPQRDGGPSEGTMNPSRFLYHNGLKHFLPAQFPHSVAPGYAQYALYSFGASIAGSAAMVLSTQTLLLAVGVVGSGPERASVLAGALNWVLKDGVGQLGGVLYASFLGRTRRFDANPKRWRMVAALCMDLGTLIEILCPYATKSSGLILPLACLANVLKNMGFLTAGASRASLHQALATSGNLGDVTAKSGSQSTAAGLCGTCLGIGLSTVLSTSVSVESYVLAFCGLSMLHQVGNYLSVQAVPLSHFNRQRLHIMLEDYHQRIKAVEAEPSLPDAEALSPQEVASRESFLPWMPDQENDGAYTDVIVGRALNVLAPKGGHALIKLVDIMEDEAYLLNLHDDGSVHVVFRTEASGTDLLQAMLHAYVLKGMPSSPQMSPFDSVAASLRIAKRHIPLLMKDMDAKGWRITSEAFIIEPRDAVRFCFDERRTY